MKHRVWTLMLLLLAAATAMADPPSVDVRFVIEAQQFVDGLGGSRRSVERALTQTLLDECRDQKSFPFLRWTNGDAATPNRLVVALVQRPAGGDFETLLEYRATTKADGELRAALQESVYRWFDAKNADTADILKARLQKRIREQFAGERFRKDLLRYFVSRIPLAEKVVLDRSGHRVIVPVAATALLADERESELAVTFFAKNDGQPGSMTLRDPLDFPERGVVCRIKDINFRGLLLDGDWSDHLSQALDPTKIRDVRVTMFTYVPKWFADASHGSLTSD
jgi:hypothetical protein